MSSVTITVPKEYGYVVATTAFTFFLGLWHGARAQPYRRKSKLVHPKNFAEAADIAAAPDAETKKAMHLYNCAQRAHANYVENQPQTALAMLIAGLRYPQTSALLGVGWIIGRVVFAIGYTRSDKPNGSGRVPGFLIQFPMQLGLWGLAAWTGIKMAL